MLCSPPNMTQGTFNRIGIIWVHGTAGSALRSQCRGRGFESPMLHQNRQTLKMRFVFFCLQNPGCAGVFVDKSYSYPKSGRGKNGSTTNIFIMPCAYKPALRKYTQQQEFPGTMRAQSKYHCRQVALQAMRGWHPRSK